MPASHTILVTIINCWQAHIGHLEDGGQVCLANIASCAFSEAGNIMAGEEVCHDLLYVPRVVSAQFLKSGNKRVGEVGVVFYADVPRSTAWLDD